MNSLRTPAMVSNCFSAILNQLTSHWKYIKKYMVASLSSVFFKVLKPTELLNFNAIFPPHCLRKQGNHHFDMTSYLKGMSQLYKKKKTKKRILLVRVVSLTFINTTLQFFINLTIFLLLIYKLPAINSL